MRGIDINGYYTHSTLSKIHENLDALKSEAIKNDQQKN